MTGTIQHDVMAQEHRRNTPVGRQTGCSDAARWVVDEQWRAPRGGAMLGMSRTSANGRLLKVESIVLREQDGRIAYHAQPSGQPAAVFLFT